jgi:hypothetical protein
MHRGGIGYEGDFRRTFFYLTNAMDLFDTQIIGGVPRGPEGIDFVIKIVFYQPGEP